MSEIGISGSETGHKLNGRPAGPKTGELQQFRKANSLSRVQFAQMLDVSESSVKRWERGEGIGNAPAVKEALERAKSQGKLPNGDLATLLVSIALRGELELSLTDERIDEITRRNEAVVAELRQLEPVEAVRTLKKLMSEPFPAPDELRAMNILRNEIAEFEDHFGYMKKEAERWASMSDSERCRIKAETRGALRFRNGEPAAEPHYQGLLHPYFSPTVEALYGRFYDLPDSAAWHGRYNGLQAKLKALHEELTPYVHRLGKLEEAYRKPGALYAFLATGNRKETERARLRALAEKVGFVLPNARVEHSRREEAL